MEIYYVQNELNDSRGHIQWYWNRYWHLKKRTQKWPFFFAQPPPPPPPLFFFFFFFTSLELSTFLRFPSWNLLNTATCPFRSFKARLHQSRKKMSAGSHGMSPPPPPPPLPPCPRPSLSLASTTHSFFPLVPTPCAPLGRKIRAAMSDFDFFLFFFFSVIRLPASWSLRVIGTSLAATPFTGQSAVVARKASLRALPLAEATGPFCAPVDTVRHVLFSPDEQRYYIPVSPRVRNPSFPISLALRHLCLPSARRCGWCWWFDHHWAQTAFASSKQLYANSCARFIGTGSKRIKR